MTVISRGLRPLIRGLRPLIRGLRPLIRGLRPLIRGLRPEPHRRIRRLLCHHTEVLLLCAVTQTKHHPIDSPMAPVGLALVRLPGQALRA